MAGGRVCVLESNLFVLYLLDLGVWQYFCASRRRFCQARGEGSPVYGWGGWGLDPRAPSHRRAVVAGLLILLQWGKLLEEVLDGSMNGRFV